MGLTGPRRHSGRRYTGRRGPRLDNNHIHRETHNANRKDAAYYAGMSTEGSRGSSRRRAYLPFSANDLCVCVYVWRALSLFHRLSLNCRRIERHSRLCRTRITFSAFECTQGCTRMKSTTSGVAAVGMPHRGFIIQMGFNAAGAPKSLYIDQSLPCRMLRAHCSCDPN